MNQLGGGGPGGLDDDPYIFGRRYQPGGRGEPAQQQRENRLDLSQIVNSVQQMLDNEGPKADIVSSLAHQLSQDEKIIESILLILLTNEKIEC